MTTTDYQTITSSCACCGVTFQQLADPGRRRRFCSNACRQKDYRKRSGKNGNEARQQRKQQEERKREEDARRARERRARQAREEAARAGAQWTAPRAGDNPAQARNRARCRKLMDRASHPRTPVEEATACREKAETIRSRHGL